MTDQCCGKLVTIETVALEIIERYKLLAIVVSLSLYLSMISRAGQKIYARTDASVIKSRTSYAHSYTMWPRTLRLLVQSLPDVARRTSPLFCMSLLRSWRSLTLARACAFFLRLCSRLARRCARMLSLSAGAEKARRSKHTRRVCTQEERCTF